MASLGQVHPRVGGVPSGVGVPAVAEPLALPHHNENLLHQVLENNRVKPSDLEEGDRAVVQCLEAASRTMAKLGQIEPLLSRVVDAAGKIPKAVNNDTGTLSGLSGGGVARSQLRHLVPQSKRKRGPLRSGGGGGCVGSGGGSAIASYETTADASIAVDGAAAGSKGLKHFSLKVSEKVEGKGFTNYNEVADELVREMAADAAAGLGEGSSDEKNIRRRVYDALNVLEALEMIDKGKKDIRWLGWPPALGQSSRDRLEAERNKIAARLAHKAQVAAAVATKAFCLSNLVHRNQDAPLSVMRAAQEMGLAAPTPLPLPFMLIHAPPEAEIDIHITEDQLNASLDFYNHPFQIFDDEGVMRMMGLGECRSGLQPMPVPTSAAEAGPRQEPIEIAMGLSSQLEEQHDRVEAEGVGATPLKHNTGGGRGGGGGDGLGGHGVPPELSPSAGLSAMGLDETLNPNAGLGFGNAPLPGGGAGSRGEETRI